MAEPLEVAKLYFELSNKSDFAGIQKLFTDTTTYSSRNTGIHLGSQNIIEMQRAYHGKFTTLHWHVKSIEEVKPGIVLFDFDFEGTLPDGEVTKYPGLEYVVIRDGKILHIETRDRPHALN